MSKLVKVLAVRRVKNPGTVYDVTVANNHNLFVRHAGSEHSVLAHNCVFDLHQLIDLLKLQWYNHDIWDTEAGAAGLDENRVLRPNVGYDKRGIYTLERLALESGMNHYSRTKLGKGDRSRLETKPLEEVAEYGGVDVVIPVRLYRMQRAVARFRNERFPGRPYEGYERAVVQVEGVKLEQFCWQERAGLPVDVDYLVRMRSVKSEFLAEIKASEEKLRATKGVVEANRRLLAGKNIRATSLFGKKDQVARVFDPGKREHQAMLFFKVLELEPIETNADGIGSTDKTFKEKYREVPEVAAYADYDEARNLNSTFIVGFYKILRGNPDNSDGRLHPYYNNTLLTQRSSANKPNLQNIPEHKTRAALVKRQFVATRGKLFCKRDFSAHEIRMWGIASRDPNLALAFWNGMRERLRHALAWEITKEEADEWKKVLKGADIHNQNYGLMHGVDPISVAKSDRDKFKRVIFGALYGKGIASLSKDIKADEDETRKIYDLIFRDKFRRGGAWVERTKKVGRANVLVPSMMGSIRHLWGYLHPENKVKAAMDRRGPNSIIQGPASNLGFMGGYETRRLAWRMFGSRGIDLGYVQCNSVHDSSESEVPPVNIPLVNYLADHGYTTMLHVLLRDEFGLELTTGFEMDDKVGATLAHMHDATRWDDRVNAIEASLKWGNENVGWDEPIDLIMPIVRKNAKIIHEIRRREIRAQLKAEQRVTYTMEMNRKNCLDYGLVFETPTRAPVTKRGWREERAFA